MAKEEFPSYHKKSEFEKQKDEKEKSGWVVLGVEKLTKTQFSKDSALFLEVPDQTEKEIKQKYLEKLKKQYPKHDFEVELMLDENAERLVNLRKVLNEQEYAQALKNLADQDKSYIVWARKIEK